MMAHTEWALHALDGLGLSMEIRMREALAIHMIALSGSVLAEEGDIGKSAEMTFEKVSRTQFPLSAAVPGRMAGDLEGLFEYSLARHLDGFAVMLDRFDRTP